MKNVTLNLGPKTYSIAIGHKIIEGLGSALKKLDIGRTAVIVSNSTIYHLYGRRLWNILNKKGIKAIFKLVPDSELSKSQKVCFELINKIASCDVKKRIFIIAFGGGVIGDLAGFAASIYKRGIPYVQIPTTLLAQVDSAIGGKTGIDLAVGKNLIGSFYQPKIVLSDISFLKSLSLRQIRNGLAEAVKYGIIKDAKLFAFLEKNYKDALKLDVETLEKIVYASSRIKAKIVSQDETDKTGRRAILNFGHTIGHAIEAAASFKRYSHGEAVAIGMLCACDISRKLGLLNNADAGRIENLLIKIGLPANFSKLRIKKILQAQSHDKKFIHGSNRFVLAKRIGAVLLRENIPAEVIRITLKNRLK